MGEINITVYINDLYNRLAYLRTYHDVLALELDEFICDVLYRRVNYRYYTEQYGSGLTYIKQMEYEILSHFDSILVSYHVHYRDILDIRFTIPEKMLLLTIKGKLDVV